MTKVQQIISLHAVRNTENENYALLLDLKEHMTDMLKFHESSQTKLIDFNYK